MIRTLFSRSFGSPAGSTMSDFNWPPAKNEASERFHDDFANLSLESKLIHAKAAIPKRIDPLVTPIYHSATYRYASMAQYHEPGHGQNAVYQRCGNPTVETVEVAIHELEGGAATLTYNSGQAACAAVFLEFLKPGDHIISMYPIYSGSYSYLTEISARFGVELTFVDIIKEEDFVGAVERAIKPNTKLMHFEVLANPTLEMPDLIALIKLANTVKIKISVDSTFASPFHFKPIKLGADLSIHSCSKFLGGHTDVIGGCVTAKDIGDWQRLKVQQLTTGSALCPFTASLLSRGLKTLCLRMEKISSNAMKIATFLESHPKVVSVNYPGLPSNKYHKIALQEFENGFGGIIAFDLGTKQAALALAENVRLVVHAWSLGGVESNIQHSASWSHGKDSLKGEKAPEPIGEGSLRLSVGVENTNDLIADLQRALSFV